MTTKTLASRQPGQPWSLPEAAEYLHCSVRHLRRLIDKGLINSIRLGRSIMIADQEMTRVATEGTGARASS